ncbi:MAG TPA: hypothetical protein VF203_04120 [Burkholderiales bacterium]
MLSYIARWLVFAVLCALLLLSIPAKYGHAARGADAAPPARAAAPVAVAACGPAARAARPAAHARAGARPWKTLLSPWHATPRIQTI